ncbi:hypothetical protein DPMN_009923 [Dreissena polymorpha]|uniref:Uncharacterized protein n=1 Tax=Dreissena polymorpha TaxID=45954 RepID=A0A9D4N1B1_DREPO|nr:hypothetical protein DPMN_009923 [Dreissena polymorpha]
MPVCLSVCLPACLPACLSVCLPACLYVCLPACKHMDMVDDREFVSERGYFPEFFGEGGATEHVFAFQAKRKAVNANAVGSGMGCDENGSYNSETGTYALIWTEVDDGGFM